jgi:hypothetical protein
MVKSLSTEAPEIFRRDPDGSTVFRWDVKQTEDGYEANECRIHTTPTQENIERGAIEAYCSLSDQAALLHDNNKSLQITGRQTAEYATFLSETKRIKTAVQDYFDSIVEHEAGWVEQQALIKLAYAIEDKRREIQEEKCLRRDNGLVVDGIKFDTDPNAQTMYTQYMVALLMDNTYAIPDWKASDGVFVVMDGVLFMQIRQAWTDHISALTTRQKAKDAEVEALTSLADVESYDVSGGWD